MFHQLRGYTGQGDGSIITWLTFTFLYTGATNVVFQSLGTIPVDKEHL